MFYMKKNILIFAILLITNILCNAQTIGEWTMHTPGMTVISVDVMHEKIFAATPYDVYYYNTYDNSINRLSKVNGLSDIGINVIKYNKSLDVIFVGYSNTNIDIIDNQDNITNIPDIYNKNILGSKTINDVFFKDELAYVCCGFGIVVIDLRHNEVKDTYIIGDNGSYLNINDLDICNNVIYAGTSNGIYYADANDQHLADYSQWKRFNHHLPNYDGNFSNIECFDGYIVANYSDNQTDGDLLYTISDTTSWGYFIDGQQNLISELRVCDDRIIVTESIKEINVFDKNINCIYSLNGIEPYSTVFDKTKNCYWSGSKVSSLVKLYQDGRKEIIKFNGPYSNKIFEINASGSGIYVASGGYTGSWAPTWSHDGYFHYDGSTWTFNNPWTNNVFDSVTDITCVKTHPLNRDRVYVGSYSRGLLVFEGNTLKNLYNCYTPGCSLGKHLVLNYTFVTGLDFDSNNNVWIANSGTDKKLSVFKANGTWEAFNIGNGGGDIGRIMVDKNDIKWIMNRGGEITVFQNNVYKTVNINTNTGNLPGTANCFVTDNNGTVWVGTTDGVALFNNSNKIFSSNSYSCSRILIPRNDGSGQADYLLSGQTVLAIAVDGANNIWFGTNDGVIQTSNDGQTTYHHFTTDNSPLLSNTVKDIAIDDDGNVFFSTDNGLISYKGTASKGGETNSNVIVYPNPVRPEHRGVVGIKGLVTNALVKITTTSGSFVTHLRAEGGQAVWDCTDINGRKVEPGIYLIFVSDDTGKETYATKVLIMK